MRLSMFAAVVGLLAGWAGGGRLGALRSIRLQMSILPLAWAVLTFSAGRLEAFEHASVLTVVGLVALVVFGFANVRRLPGLGLLGVGAALNGLVIGLNRGMPYSIDAVHHAGLHARIPARLFSATVLQHPITSSDRFARLGNVIAFLPFREVLSVGTIVSAVGLGASVYGAMCRPDGAVVMQHLLLNRRQRADATARAEATARGFGVRAALVSRNPQSVDRSLEGIEEDVVDLRAYESDLIDVQRQTGLADTADGVALVRLLAAAPSTFGDGDAENLWRLRERVRQLHRAGAEREAADSDAELDRASASDSARIAEPGPLSTDGEGVIVVLDVPLVVDTTTELSSAGLSSSADLSSNADRVPR